MAVTLSRDRRSLDASQGRARQGREASQEQKACPQALVIRQRAHHGGPEHPAHVAGGGERSDEHRRGAVSSADDPVLARRDLVRLAASAGHREGPAKRDPACRDGERAAGHGSVIEGRLEERARPPRGRHPSTNPRLWPSRSSSGAPEARVVAAINWPAAYAPAPRSTAGGEPRPQVEDTPGVDPALYHCGAANASTSSDEPLLLIATKDRESEPDPFAGAIGDLGAVPSGSAAAATGSILREPARAARGRAAERAATANAIASRAPVTIHVQRHETFARHEPGDERLRRREFRN